MRVVGGGSWLKYVKVVRRGLEWVGESGRA